MDNIGRRTFSYIYNSDPERKCKVSFKQMFCISAGNQNSNGLRLCFIFCYYESKLINKIEKN